MLAATKEDSTISGSGGQLPADFVGGGPAATKNESHRYEDGETHVPALRTPVVQAPGGEFESQPRVCRAQATDCFVDSGVERPYSIVSLSPRGEVSVTPSDAV